MKGKQASNNVLSLLQTGTVKQAIFMLGVAVSVAAGIALFSSIREPTYRALDYQVNQKNIGSIIDTLDKAGIKYKVNDRDGILLVAADSVQEAKLKLASAGVAKDDGFSFAYLNDQTGLANSQFLENARYLRALESDLSKTISSIEGVSGAKVHIAVPRNNIFADENNKVTASVVLNISASFASDKEKIRSIIQVIADSVPGLDPKNIAITDQYGHYLSEGLDQNSLFSTAQLNYQNNMQKYYENRIESMIIPILGENKVVVRVNADIDYTQQENAQEEYDPDKSVILSEQNDNEENSSSGASGAPGSLSNSPDEKPAAPSSASSAAGNKRTQSTKNYNVSKTVTYKKSNAAKVKSLSVAVVVDNEMVLDPKTKKYVSNPVSKEKLEKITELVKTVIGYDEKRGDKVTVVNSVYSPVKQEAPVAKMALWENPWFWDVAKRIIGIILGFIFLFFAVKKLSNFNIPVARSSKNSSMFVQDEEDENNKTVFNMHEAKQDGINRLKDLAVNDPVKVASIIKTWVGK